MQESQTQDLKIVIEELSTAQTNAESVKARLAVCQALATKQAEEIAAYSSMKKKLRVASYIELSIGVPCLVLGLVPIWNDNQQNLKNVFLGVGAAATVSGVTTFTFTITF